jgi:hypothetical protein
MDLYKQQTGQPHPLDQPPAQPVTAPVTAGVGGGQTTDTVNQQLAATQRANAQAAGVPAGQPSTAAMNAQGMQDTPQNRMIMAAQATPNTAPPGMFQPSWSMYPSAVGQPATGPTAANGFVQPLPFNAPATV